MIWRMGVGSEPASSQTHEQALAVTVHAELPRKGDGSCEPAGADREAAFDSAQGLALSTAPWQP
jgi:hypothetical protein